MPHSFGINGILGSFDRDKNTAGSELFATICALGKNTVAFHIAFTEIELCEIVDAFHDLQFAVVACDVVVLAVRDSKSVFIDLDRVGTFLTHIRLRYETQYHIAYGVAVRKTFHGVSTGGSQIRQRTVDFEQIAGYRNGHGSLFHVIGHARGHALVSDGSHVSSRIHRICTVHDVLGIKRDLICVSVERSGVPHSLGINSILGRNDLYKRHFSVLRAVILGTGSKDGVVFGEGRTQRITASVKDMDVLQHLESAGDGIEVVIVGSHSVGVDFDEVIPLFGHIRRLIIGQHGCARDACRFRRLTVHKSGNRVGRRGAVVTHFGKQIVCRNVQQYFLNSCFHTDGSAFFAVAHRLVPHVVGTGIRCCGDVGAPTVRGSSFAVIAQCILHLAAVSSAGSDKRLRLSGVSRIFRIRLLCHLGSENNVYLFLPHHIVTDLRRITDHHIQFYDICGKIVRFKNGKYCLHKIRVKVNVIRRIFTEIDSYGYTPSLRRIKYQQVCGAEFRHILAFDRNDQRMLCADGKCLGIGVVCGTVAVERHARDLRHNVVPGIFHHIVILGFLVPYSRISIGYPFTRVTFEGTAGDGASAVVSDTRQILEGAAADIQRTAVYINRIFENTALDLYRITIRCQPHLEGSVSRSIHDGHLVIRRKYKDIIFVCVNYFFTVQIQGEYSGVDSKSIICQLNVFQ